MPGFKINEIPYYQSLVPPDGIKNSARMHEENKKSVQRISEILGSISEQEMLYNQVVLTFLQRREKEQEKRGEKKTPVSITGRSNEEKERNMKRFQKNMKDKFGMSMNRHDIRETFLRLRVGGVIDSKNNLIHEADISINN